MKILIKEQVREADAYTVKNEPVESIDLMERAARQLYREFINRFTSDHTVEVYAGPGNNGGDGIALTRMLADKGYRVNLNIMDIGKPLSGDLEINYKRLPVLANLKVKSLDESARLPIPEKGAIIVDALFGSGLDRPLEGFPARLVDHINEMPNIRLAIDIPSGLFAESNPAPQNKSIIRAKYTWCFQFPKLAFLMPENEEFVGEWKILDIGLHQDFIDNCDTPYHYITQEMVSSLMPKRQRYAHKGHYGHALLIAGGKGRIGASLLAARSCLRSGVGLLTVHIPAIGMQVLHTALPEAMISMDKNKYYISRIPDIRAFNAIGAGPGLGTGKATASAIRNLLDAENPMVLDADALNIISRREDFLEKLPEGVVLTPHPGEYVRLFGQDNDHYSRLMRMREIARTRKIVIVLKGANTAIAGPDGQIWFNSTGNPGMATAGSGDVLTGIILSLLSQGYPPREAAVTGVFVHGMAGDMAEGKAGLEGLIAGDIIDWLPAAFMECRKKNKEITGN